MLRTPFKIPLVITGFAQCASTTFNVPDDKFFADGYLLDKSNVQLVEYQDGTTVMQPAAQRFAKNCTDAETKARARFRAMQPQAKDEGRRLSEHFEKNAACRVRMAFRVN